VKTLAAAIHAALAAVALAPKLLLNPDVNVGVITNSTSAKVQIPLRGAAISIRNDSTS